MTLQKEELAIRLIYSEVLLIYIDEEGDFCCTSMLDDSGYITTLTYFFVVDEEEVC